MTSDLTHRLMMRWSDLDTYGHLNNVAYLAYAAEARSRLFERGLLAAENRPVSVAIDFVRPMILSTAPVWVDQHVDGAILEQELWQEHDGERTDYARIRTELAPGRSFEEPVAPASAHHLPLESRRADADAADLLNDVAALEYFQETRVLALAGPGGPPGLGDFVLARTELDLDPSATYRSEPWDFTVAIGRIGTKSFTVDQQWWDGDVLRGRARNVLVTFDIATQRSRPMTDAERAALTAW